MNGINAYRPDNSAGDPFGMVKCPPTRESKGHFESPGRWWFHVLYIVCARKLGNRSNLTCAYFSNGLKSPVRFAKEKVSGFHNTKKAENKCIVAKMNTESSYKIYMKITLLRVIPTMTCWVEVVR